MIPTVRQKLRTVMSNLGTNFKKARESLGIPIEKIAAETRISVRFLTAIESQEFRLLPGGIFNRGFIRAYAEYVGLNPEDALAEYDRMGHAGEEPVEALRSVERQSRRNSERHLYTAAAVLLALLIAGYYIATRGGSGEVTVRGGPETATASPIVVPPAQNEQSPALPASVTLEAPPAAAPLPSLPAAAPPLANPSPSLVLDVSITELSWVKVTADGTVEQSGELPAGTSRRFTANSSIALSVGNAGGTNVRINGRDPGPLGPSGSVRHYSITPENSATLKFQ